MYEMFRGGVISDFFYLIFDAIFLFMVYNYAPRSPKLSFIMQVLPNPKLQLCSVKLITHSSFVVF